MIAVIIAIIAPMFYSQPMLGGSTSDTWTAGDLVSNDDLTVTDDATISGGSLAVTTSNTATSTISGGCIQLTATSTANPIRLRPGAMNVSATTTWSTTTGLGGYMVWEFGTCP